MKTIKNTLLTFFLALAGYSISLNAAETELSVEDQVKYTKAEALSGNAFATERYADLLVEHHILLDDAFWEQNARDAYFKAGSLYEKNQKYAEAYYAYSKAYAFGDNEALQKMKQIEQFIGR